MAGFRILAHYVQQANVSFKTPLEVLSIQKSDAWPESDVATPEFLLAIYWIARICIDKVGVMTCIERKRRSESYYYSSTVG